MKLLYISSPAFADCDFPLIKSFMEKGLDITYLILITPYELHSTLIDIQHIYPHTGIFPASIYPELTKYRDYMDMDRVFVCNRHGLSRKTLSYWKDILNLYKFIKKGNYDIIHTDLLFHDERKLVYGLGNVITTIHDPFPHSGENWNYNQKAYYSAINNSKGLVLLNEGHKIPFCKEYGIEECKILTNHLGIYEVTGRNFLSPPNLATGKNILFFGRIAPYKGIEYLCEAMKTVRKTIPDATLTIAGGGKIYFNIEKYIKDGYVELINRYVKTEELQELLSKASITACPYTDATQSGVIMTSFSLGRPVVATNVGGLREMIDNGKTGIIVPPKDPASLAEAIISILSDPTKLIQMNNNIEKEFQEGDKSWLSIAERYISFYKKIISTSK